MRFIPPSLCMLMIITLTTGAWASKTIRKPDTKYINEADVLLTVTITERVNRADPCDTVAHFKLKPVKAHGGKMREAPLRYQISWPSLYTENGEVKKGCPESVWYIRPPQARELKRGATIVVTAIFDKQSAQFYVTASFDVGRLDELKKLFKARPKR